MQIKNTVVILVWTTLVFAQPEISDGTVTPPNRIEANGSWTMTDGNGVWTRAMNVDQGDISSHIVWRWEFFGRRNDCTPELKRNLTKFGCPLDAGGGKLIYCPEGYVPGPNGNCVPESPVVIDLDGNGIKLTSRANGTRFDLNYNGEKGLLPWLEYGSQDAWLVFNTAEDGVIENGRQLFGDKSPQAEEKYAGEPRNGYRALRVLTTIRMGQ